MVQKTPNLGLNRPEDMDEMSRVEYLNENWSILEPYLGVPEVSSLPTSSNRVKGQLVRHEGDIKLWDGSAWKVFKDGYNRVGDTDGWETLHRKLPPNSAFNPTPVIGGFEPSGAFTRTWDYLEVRARRIGPFIELIVKFNQAGSGDDNGTSGPATLHPISPTGVEAGALTPPLIIGTLTHDRYSFKAPIDTKYTIAGSYVGAPISDNMKSSDFFPDMDMYPFFASIGRDTGEGSVISVEAIQSPAEVSTPSVRFCVPNSWMTWGTGGVGRRYKFNEENFFAARGVYFAE